MKSVGCTLNCRTYLLHKGKYDCMADLLFNRFGLNQRNKSVDNLNVTKLLHFMREQKHYFSLRPKAKDLGISGVVVGLVGFFVSKTHTISFSLSLCIFIIFSFFLLLFFLSFYYFLSPYLSIILLYMSTYLPMCIYLPIYINTPTYQWLPTNLCQHTYLPTYLHQHTYLPMCTYQPMSTYYHIPTYLYQP